MSLSRPQHICQALWLLAILAFAAVPAFSAGEPMRVLVSGFEPFGGMSQNPSEELVRYINEHFNEKTPLTTDSGPAIVRGVTLPVTYYKCWEVLHQAIADFKPTCVIALGLAAIPGLRIETMAKNGDRGGPDNKGNGHKGAIYPAALEELATKLPVDAIKEALEKNKIPATTSKDAGGYLCNHIFYHLMRYATSHPELRAGFIHVPNWPVEGEKSLWPAIKTVIETLQKAAPAPAKDVKEAR